jgi:hypothetical protein
MPENPHAKHVLNASQEPNRLGRRINPMIAITNGSPNHGVRTGPMGTATGDPDADHDLPDEVR